MYWDTKPSVIVSDDFDGCFRSDYDDKRYNDTVYKSFMKNMGLQQSMDVIEVYLLFRIYSSPDCS